MKTKTFTVPRVFLTTADHNPLPGSDVAEPEYLRPIPLNYGEWIQSRWIVDVNGSGSVDFDDYAKWWAQCGFGSDTWTQYNPDVQWNDEWTR
jgi:hypothetical protein